MPPAPTARLRLREMTESDLDAMAGLLGDPDVMRYYPRPRTREEARAWIDWNRRSYAEHGYGLWVLETHEGEFVGDCGLTWQPVGERQVLEVGYHVLPRHQGRGYATEAARACLELATGAIGEQHVVAIVHPDNAASRRVAERIGMREEQRTVVHGRDVVVLGTGGDQPQVRPLADDELDRAAHLLARAFHDYPWTRWSLPADGYDERLLEIQRLYLGYAREQGVVLVDDDVRGVVALLPRTAPPPTPAMQARVAEVHGDRLADVGSLALPPVSPGWWTLETLGVAPEHRGHGLGLALVRAGLERVGGAGVALLTSSEENVRLYARAGFAVVSTVRAPGGPPVRVLHRQPASR
ncbi:GNAT family N-acetyltransferase [Nocardioides nanhaiensis]|uniref:N-acetyltransferase domain-containing protein n=1 Tax=Nocardioides nanhaiensis TaxID=1476871 RepID=A0ABP8X6E0_9ACTN